MQNALNTVQAAAGIGAWNKSSAVKPEPLKPGRSLVLLYLVQLIKQDALPRLQLVQQQMQELKAGGGSAGPINTVRERLALVLRNSLLVRLLQVSGGMYYMCVGIGSPAVILMWQPQQLRLLV